MCLIGSVLEGGPKTAKNGLAMGVTNGGAAAKSGKNTHLLVIIVPMECGTSTYGDNPGI